MEAYHSERIPAADRPQRHPGCPRSHHTRCQTLLPHTLPLFLCSAHPWWSRSCQCLLLSHMIHSHHQLQSVHCPQCKTLQWETYIEYRTWYIIGNCITSAWYDLMWYANRAQGGWLSYIFLVCIYARMGINWHCKHVYANHAAYLQSQITPASSLCKQLVLGILLWVQFRRLSSFPWQTTLSNKICLDELLPK